LSELSLLRLAVCIIAKSLMWSGVFLCVSASAFSCSSGCVGSERAVTAGLVWVSACFARSWSPNLIVLMRWGWNWPAEIEAIGIPNHSSPLVKLAGRGVDLRRRFSACARVWLMCCLMYVVIHNFVMCFLNVGGMRLSQFQVSLYPIGT
jgi:hypothetical protein